MCIRDRRQTMSGFSPSRRERVPDAAERPLFGAPHPTKPSSQHVTMAKGPNHPVRPKVFVSKLHQDVMKGTSAAPVGAYDPTQINKPRVVHTSFGKEDRFGLSKSYVKNHGSPGVGSYNIP
eukprot:TRINITY_DN12914_c0_g2_i1.p1 TRINITY_DN12914_c0_g2~~TRINITY_DN12914_c0_g2_i1.p1  ORF type:complete len:121 (+),score=21.36 TRINITY_DN12914_c0_g2_i1:161-523(+)